MMDWGTPCGTDFVNGSAGLLDGYSIVNGHEWAETLTDWTASTGWVNSTGSSSNGEENGDECAWISPNSGQGSAADVTMSTGSFAMQSTWSNDTNECDISHAIVGSSGSTGNTVTVNSPGNQTGTVGTGVSLQITGSDSASGQTLSYTSSTLPAGLSISTSGLITGTPTTAGTSSVTVTATDSTNATGSTNFSWTINPAAGNTVTVTNPGPQTGTVGTGANLQIHATDSASGQTLTYSATGLPPTLSINSSTGLITGTETAAGTYSVTVTAKDSTNASGSAPFSWTVNPATNTVTVTNPGTQTSKYNTTIAPLQIHATDTGSSTLTYRVSGLPSGLSLNTSTGVITGRPFRLRTYTVTVTATDTTGAHGSATFTWIINRTGASTRSGTRGHAKIASVAETMASLIRLA
jgi:hypothetical protein